MTDIKQEKKRIDKKASKLMPLYLCLSLGLLLSAPLLSAENEETPGIYIKKIIDRSSSLVPGFKAQYELCAEQRSLNKMIFDQGSVGWEAIKEDLPEGYDIRAVTRPEPDWKKRRVGVDIEKEYFYGDKYAVYNYVKDYEISEADRCALVEHEHLNIKIDNGNERYIINLREKLNPGITPGAGQISLAAQYAEHRVKQVTSPVRIREENDLALQKISKDERITSLLTSLFSSAEGNRVPGAPRGVDTDLPNKIKEAIGYEESNATKVIVPRANDEHTVAGQACDIISANTLNTRLWYWSKMHHYPSEMERAIILKSEVTNQANEVMMLEEAIEFKILPEIDDAIFEVESSLK